MHSLAPETVDTQIAFPALRPTRFQIGNHLERHLTDIALTQGQVTVTLTPGAYIAVVIELEAR